MSLSLLLAAADSAVSTSSRLEWRSLPSAAGSVATIALLLGLGTFFVLLYFREAGSIPAPKRIALAILRLLTLLAAFLVLWEPVLVRDEEEILDSTVAIAVDASKSMDFADIPAKDLRKAFPEAKEESAEKVSRATVVRWLLRNEKARFVEGFRKNHHVQFGAFSRAWEPLETFEIKDPARPARAPAPGEAAKKEPAIPFEKIQPRGPSTNIAQAIRSIVDGMGGKPLAALVLFTDGQHNEGEDPRAAAAYAAERGVPIYAVALGDPSPFKNIRVHQVLAPEAVNRRDPLPITAQILAEGLSGVSAEVEVTETPRLARGRGVPKVLKREAFTLPADGQSKEYAFRHIPDEAGEFYYEVAVRPVEGERVEDDNKGGALTRVLDDKRKVLMVAGSPTREYHFVKALLTRDKTVDVSCFLQTLDAGLPQEGDLRIAKLPDAEEDLFSYDAVLLLDPAPDRTFPPSFAEMLKRFVGEQGGGLLYVAGEKNTTRFLTAPGMEPLLDVLPVVPDTDSPDAREVAGRARTREIRVEPTGEAMSNPTIPILQIATGGDPTESRQILEKMPGIYWSYPVRQEKPVATVLARGRGAGAGEGEGPILLACQIFESGRSVFQAYDESWRFRRNRENHFNRYWIQTCRYLFQGRLLGKRGRFKVFVDRPTYPLGDPVKVTVRAFDKGYRPLETPTLQANVRPTEGAEVSVPLALVPGRPGHYEGQFVPETLGLYDLWVREEDSAEQPPTQHFKVVMPNLELENPRMNEPLLKEIAGMTGGKFLGIEDARKLPDEIPSRQERITLSSTPDAVWDTAWTMILFVFLLSLEWLLRKRWRMV